MKPARTTTTKFPNGRFLMGSDQHYPEERPARHVDIDAFEIDDTAVSNGQFATFVADTGYVTLAERGVSRDDVAGMPDEFYRPGSLVFQMTTRSVPLSDPRAWWRFVEGASWRHPEGPASSIEDRQNHPVVHISFKDASAYSEWAGKILPTEEQWERAASASHESHALRDEDLNIWHGQFPHSHDHRHGHPFTVLVGTPHQARNGPINMLGNVWEWTRTPFTPQSQPKSACCVGDRTLTMAQYTLKGGSYLCSPAYCRRYRPAARIGVAVTETAGHLGFRCSKPLGADPE